ncbi:hypothetical protein BcepSauron_328 [Burkholderia phage BcepSauron]|uniref:Uncharacterized protein n=1 Tax=Burkholderia phage BcepSauron TaxID=2530033 RepID=A0A482MM22_9CAUD|nr:hypothetical protein H1O17_gp328 [Burkholderia phage BcepSauron]QBQ74708.1 hypothetical protein BcepSauron_328 [Burkholderia phage BcepSauron]
MEEPKINMAVYPQLVTSERFEHFIENNLEKHLIEWFGQTALDECEGMINRVRIASMTQSFANKLLTFARIEHGPVVSEEMAVDAARAMTNLELRINKPKLNEWEETFAGHLLAVAKVGA